MKKTERLLSLLLTFCILLSAFCIFTPVFAADSTAQITSLYVLVDGKTYTSGSTVTLTPESGDVTIVVNGINLNNSTDDNSINYKSYYATHLYNIGWTINPDGTVATYTISSSEYRDLAGTHEIRYRNDGVTYISSGIFITYDYGDKIAEITGLSITVGGVTFTSGTAVLSPYSGDVTVTVTGTNLQNGTTNNVIKMKMGFVTTVASTYAWTFTNGGTVATYTLASSYFSNNTTAFEIQYTNQGSEYIGSGVSTVYSTTTYAIAVDSNISGGTVTANKTNAAAGELVTLNVTPASGCEISTVRYNDGTDHTITPSDGKYIFTMPEKDVSISVTFKSSPTKASDGTYQIDTAPELIWFEEYVNSGNKTANAVLTDNIDMTGIAWTPICSTELYYSSDYSEGYGDKDTGYAGTFDGNGYVIKNLSVTGSPDENISFGLFGTVSGTVKNVGMENFTYTGAGKDTRIGSIVGQLIGGTVQNCYAANLNINTQVNTTNGVAGGIVGCNYAGTIENCYVYDLTMSAGRYGGIVGDNRADTENDRVGTMKNCYTNFANYVGTYKGTETNCAVKLDRQFTNGEVAVLLGSNWKQGENNLPALRGSTIYENTCGGDIFYATTDTDYASHSLGTNQRCTVCGNYDAAELADGVYQIGSLSNLMWYAERMSIKEITVHKALLTDNITIDNSVVWKPISLTDEGKTSEFNGGGHTITFDNTNEDSTFGLFGSYNYGIIENLRLAGSITCNAEGNTGVLVNSAYATTIRKVISTCNIVGNEDLETGTSGGLAGYFGGSSTKALIENCAVYADIRGGSIAGGLIGNIWNGKQPCSVKNSVYVGNVTSTTNSGAIAGLNGNVSGYTSYFTNLYYCETDGISYLCATNGGTISGTPTAVTTEQLESGEVAYLLGSAWGQTLNTDKYPLVGDDKVYKYIDGYSNENVFGFVEISDDKKTVKVNIPTAGTYKVIFADYSDSGLVSMESKDVTETSLTAETTLSLAAGDKIMLWSDLGTLSPKCEALEIAE